MLRLKGTRRAGISLIEVLVVLAVLAILLGLLIPAVQRVRQAAAKAQCHNNLRQLGVAIHNMNDAQGRLPPTVGPVYPTHDKSYGTLFFHLLPYVELDNLYKQGRDQDGGFRVWKKRVFRNQIAVFKCPDDKSGPESGLYKDYLATSNYAGNWLVFGHGGARIPANFPDGTSNTIVFSERYQMCNGTPTAWGYPGLYYWTPMFAYYSQGKFQTQPSQSQCDPALAQSSHANGIPVCMGDASVRFVDRTISPQTWWYACTPAGGEVLGADW
jgi:prepilin-type N-terminal cleavage/methylation domain-containing protein